MRVFSIQPDRFIPSHRPKQSIEIQQVGPLLPGWILRCPEVASVSSKTRTLSTTAKNFAAFQQISLFRAHHGNSLFILDGPPKSSKKNIANRLQTINDIGLNPSTCRKDSILDLNSKKFNRENRIQDHVSTYFTSRWMQQY